MTLDEKQTYEAASAAADKRVTSLEKDRDVAWHLARGNLALASNPPIRSSKVFEFMKSETDKFAQLEAAITQAKAEAAAQAAHLRPRRRRVGLTREQKAQGTAARRGQTRPDSGDCGGGQGACGREGDAARVGD